MDLVHGTVRNVEPSVRAERHRPVTSLEQDALGREQPRSGDDDFGGVRNHSIDRDRRRRRTRHISRKIFKNRHQLFLSVWITLGFE